MRTAAACAVWKSWENDQPAEADKSNRSTSLLPGSTLVCFLEKVTLFQAWQISAELCFRFAVATFVFSTLIIAVVRLCLVYKQFIVQWREHSRSSPAGSRSVPGVWEDGKSSILWAGQPGTCWIPPCLCAPWCLVAGEDGEAPIQKQQQAADWQGCASHPICVYAAHRKPVPFTEHFIAEGVWMNMRSINMLLVLAVLEKNPSLTSYWLHTFSMPENSYREETRSTPSTSSCNQPWKTIHQSPSFITSQLTKLLHALTLLVVQVFSQQI